MLEKIFKTIYKVEGAYEKYENTNKTVFNVLKNRANITNPAPIEITTAIDKVLNARLLMKEQQKLIEKILVKTKSSKEMKLYNIFMWKQEQKMKFEIVDKDFLDEYREEIGKKSLTIEEKKILFRNRYKDVYESNNKAIVLYNEFIETLENEKSDILDTKKLLSDYLDILKRISY